MGETGNPAQMPVLLSRLFRQAAQILTKENRNSAIRHILKDFLTHSRANDPFLIPIWQKNVARSGRFPKWPAME
jgi:hypothetical protein